MLFLESVANYFIGIHINREDVTSSASKFVFQLENAYKRDDEREEFAQAIVPPWKRHISLCQCTLRSEEEIERVKEVGIEVVYLAFFFQNRSLGKVKIRLAIIF